jgi:hypothetical protein
MVSADGFSRHPKFEFPIINSKDKPFESWYQESHDDQGSKYEVRYDLDRKSLDPETLKRLSRADSSLVLNMILLSPALIDDLILQKVAIQRPFAICLNLVEEACKLTT